MQKKAANKLINSNKKCNKMELVTYPHKNTVTWQGIFNYNCIRGNTNIKWRYFKHQKAYANLKLKIRIIPS